MQKIIMPKQGLQMTEGIITKWLAKEGDEVKEGEPLFEMETDKLTITIDSTASGTLLKITRREGDAVPITETIAYVGEKGEKAPDEGADKAAAVSARDEKAPEAPTQSDMPARGKPSGDRLFATPRAKTRAGELGIDIACVAATGPEGLVIERDVVNAQASKPAQAPKAASPLARKEASLVGRDIEDIEGTGVRGKVMARDVRALGENAIKAEPVEKRFPLKGMRKIIAARMKQSLNEMAQANHRMAVDMTQAALVREQLKAVGVKVSYNDIIIRCVAATLKDYPMMNSSIDGDEIVVKDYVNIGMAVATDKGLLVPVIRNASEMSVTKIAEAAKDLSARAKDNKLSPDELTGGTFTVTNLGMVGVDSFTAIINSPEAGILAVGAIKKQPVVLPDDTIAPRLTMWLSLTYDHRIVDGYPAAKFLGRVKELLEHPALLM